MLFARKAKFKRSFILLVHLLAIKEFRTLYIFLKSKHACNIKRTRVLDTNRVPATIPLLASTMMAVSPMLNIAFCPKFSRAKVVVVFSEAFS